MPEPAAREKATAEQEAAEVRRPKPSPAGGPSMFRTAVEAASGALPDAPAVTVEQVALAVLRVALPLHETQHADAWKAGRAETLNACGVQVRPGLVPAPRREAGTHRGDRTLT